MTSLLPAFAFFAFLLIGSACLVAASDDNQPAPQKAPSEAEPAPAPTPSPATPDGAANEQ